MSEIEYVWHPLSNYAKIVLALVISGFELVSGFS